MYICIYKTSWFVMLLIGGMYVYFKSHFGYRMDKNMIILIFANSYRMDNKYRIFNTTWPGFIPTTIRTAWIGVTAAIPVVWFVRLSD